MLAGLRASLLACAEQTPRTELSVFSPACIRRLLGKPARGAPASRWRSIREGRWVTDGGYGAFWEDGGSNATVRLAHFLKGHGHKQGPGEPGAGGWPVENGDGAGTAQPPLGSDCQAQRTVRQLHVHSE